METKNVILIGMPGSGKTTIGGRIAKLLGFEFEDVDLIIQKNLKKSLIDIIDEVGEDGFIGYEDRVLKGINTKNTVISTGGSAVYGRFGMEHLKEIGIVIYLKTSPEVIKERIGNYDKRGIITRGKNSIEDIYDDRKKLYEEYADIVFDTEKDLPQESSEKLYWIIKGYLG